MTTRQGQGTQVAMTIDQACEYVSPVYRIVDSAGNPISWVGRTAIGEFRDKPNGTGPNAGTVLLTITDAGGIVCSLDASGPDIGKYQIQLTHAQAATFPAKPCWFDLLAVEGDGRRRKAIYSTPFVRSTVSQ